MKKLAKVSVLLTAMAVLLAGCNCYNKMANRAGGITVTTTPQVLVVKGGNITTDMTVTFPAKFVDRTTVLRITPVLEFEGGQITGAAKFVQGDKVKDNYTVISRNGGSYTQTVNFPYDPRADIATMKLVIDAKCGCDMEDFENVTTIVAARGTSNIARLADLGAYLAIMPDNFKRVTTNTADADLMFLINSSQVRNVALTTEQIKMFEEFIKDAQKSEALAGVYSKGYASPEGPVQFNDNLSKARSTTAKTAVDKQLKGRGVNVNIDASAYGEDWDGFKKLVEASNIQDKELILSVLNMYSSPMQREQQIRNMSEVFEVLKTQILPQLRRSHLIANADVKGKTDAELRASMNNLNALNIEELLFLGTLVDNKDAINVYKAAADRFNDVRAINNYGVALARDGQYAEAGRAFQKAAQMKSAPEISNNLGVIALVNGNAAEARRYLSPLSSPEARANQGLLAMAEGDFAAATRTLTGYNLAVAELGNGNVSNAKAALGNLNTADADYLRAVISMREGNSTAAVTYLNSAFSKNPDLKTRAQRDIEFSTLSTLIGRF